MNMDIMYEQYLRICERTGAIPNRTDFFGYLYGIANGSIPASDSTNYAKIY